METTTFKTTNLYYFHSILEIGGIETFFYYLAKKYKDWDLTIVYSIGNEKQLNRLKQYVRCVKYTGQYFQCERAFFNFNTDIIDHVESKNGYYLVLHGDYKDMIARGQLLREKLPGHPKITQYVGVSQQVCDTWKEITGQDAILCYNPFAPDEPNKKFTLISATRLSKEKGGDRILQLSKRLDERGVDYKWYVYSNRSLPDTKISPNIIVRPSKLNIVDDIAKADFLIQLSDNEGYCYSIVEALNLGVPIIATPIPVFKEIGLDDTNSIILNFDASNIDEVIDKMLKTDFNFTYTPKKDCWDKLLIPGKSEYQKELKRKFLVQATDQYKKKNKIDVGLGRKPEPGETWVVDKIRCDLLVGQNEDKIQYVTVVKEVKE